MSLESCAALTIKRPCTIFGHDEMSDISKSQYAACLRAWRRKKLDDLLSTVTNTPIPDASPVCQQPTQDPTNHKRWLSYCWCQNSINRNSTLKTPTAFFKAKIRKVTLTVLFRIVSLSSHLRSLFKNLCGFYGIMMQQPARRHEHSELRTSSQANDTAQTIVSTSKPRRHTTPVN